MPAGRESSITSGLKQQLRVKNLDARIRLDYDGIIDSIVIGDDRASTDIGPQGEHVSAYALFKAALKHALHEVPVSDAIALVIQIIDSYSTDQLQTESGEEDPDDDLEPTLAAARHAQSRAPRRSRRNIAQSSPNTATQQVVEYVRAAIQSLRFYSPSDVQLMRESFDLHISHCSTLQTEQGKDYSQKIDDLRSLMQSTEQGYEKQNHDQLKGILEHTIRFFLTSRNKMPGTSYPKEGNLPPLRGESARVTAALKELSKYRITSISTAAHSAPTATAPTLFPPRRTPHSRTPSRQMLGQLSTGGKDFSDDDQGLDTSYRKDSTTTSSSSASSDEALPSTPILSPPEIGNIATHMMTLLHYPRIPEKDLIKPGTPEWTTFQNKVRGSGVGEKSDKKYNAGTKPRDNDIRKLVDVMEEHIVLIFTCFQKLKSGSPERIIGAFLEKMAMEWFDDSSADDNPEKAEYDRLCKEMRNRLFSERLFLSDYHTLDVAETLPADDIGLSPSC